MAMFVHIADARDRSSIERSGVTPSGRRSNPRWGVFAMPVLPNYFTSHQWLRELKRRGAQTMLGVYFRIPDREAVVVGHYNQAHTPMTAARASRVIMEAPDPRGYEVIIPRKIAAKELHAVRPVPQVTGWRYYPGAHGKYVCACPVCVPKGSIKSRTLRDAFEASMKPDRRSESAE
jgi:hypothetical protein